MAEALYRADGDTTFTLVTGTAPITVSGLSAGTTYDYPKGDGTLGEVTAGVGAVTSETVSFGALTLAGAGGYQITDENGDPVSNPTVASGTTANESLFDISASGVLTPSSNGSLSTEHGETIVVEFGSETKEITLDIEVDTYSAATNTQTEQAFAAIGTAGGKTVRLRDYGYTGARGVVTDDWNFDSEVVLTSYNKEGAVFGETWIENCSNITFDSLSFAKESGSQLILYATTSNITIQNCHIYGTTPLYTEPDADYSTTDPLIPQGIVIQGAGSHTNPSILNNDIHDVRLGIISAATVGTVRIEGNRIYTVFEDCIKVSPGADFTHIKYNFLAGVTANGSLDKNSPHPDFLQFLGDGKDWTGIEIEGNTLLYLYSRAGTQGIFLDDMNSGFYYTGAKIKGNLVINNGGSSVGIRIRQAKDCEVYGNTVVSNLAFPTQQAGITIGDDTFAGTNIVKNNASQAFVLNGTIDSANNITLGNGGSTIAYATAFEGPTFSPTTYAGALAAFAMKPNGPLDVDDSGGPSVGDVGAVGSGYVTWPSTFPGNDGSLDASYE